ncbi:MAG: 2-hydroxyacyl-CoA dehydratase family protein [bacterium]
MAAIDTGATTPEELLPHIPGILEKMPEYHASLVPRVQPELIEALLKPKNRTAVRAYAVALKQYLVDLTEKLDEGQPVVWNFPAMTPEIFFGMDLVPLLSEAYPLLLSAVFSDGAQQELDETELDGFPGHTCGMQRAPIKAAEKGLLPKPDVLWKICTVPCDSSNMSYQYAAERFKVPVVVLDSPYYNNARAFRYYADEYKRAVEKLERLTKHTVDEERLRKHVEMGNRQLEWLYGLQELRRHAPNPDPGLHRGLDLGALILCGANEKFVSYMKTCFEEAKQRVDQGKSFLPEGKREIRTLWSYAYTPQMLYLPDWLEDAFGSTYLECSLTNYPKEVVGYVSTSSVESMIEGLAWRAFHFPMHRTVMGFSDLHVNDIVTVAKTYRAEAALFGGYQGCKYAWTLPKMLGDVLRDELGIPSCTWETDVIDQRFTPHATVKELLSEFFRTLI